MAGRERALGHVFITHTLCFPVAEGAVVVPAASSDGGRCFPGDWSLSSKGKEVDQYDSLLHFWKVFTEESHLGRLLAVATSQHVGSSC